MSRRKSVYTEAFVHKNPVPAASRIGNLMFSGAILGRDAAGKLGATLDEQCAHLFGNMRHIVEAGGGSIEDIAKVTLWMRDRSDRSALNREWVKMFPDPASRPARHIQLADPADEAMIRCEFIAVLDGARS